MKKPFFILLVFLLFFFKSFTQDKYYTKTGTIYFECSKSPLEKVEANNSSVTCVLDTKTGVMQFAVLMRSFEFKKALMQEHFNENYVESHKYPKSEFRGQITNNSDINYSKDGDYPAMVKGQLTIHGETHEIESGGKLSIKGGKIIAVSDFSINLSDYKISIPSVVNDKISNTVNLKIDCKLDPLIR